MAKCKNSALISKITTQKLDKRVEVDFAVLNDLDSCVKINTKNYVDYEGVSATFTPYSTPDDMFNCLAEGCRNTGTLTVSGTADDTVSAEFSVLADATEFVGGIVTYYLKLPTAGEYAVKTEISDINETPVVNSDIYEQVITPNFEGFYPIVLDLSKTPSYESGEGWDVSESGIILKISVTAADETVIPIIGFSSISIFDSLEEFEVNDVVKLGCLSEIAGDLTADATDASCFGGGYDPSSVSVERTITAGQVTPNFWKLNPLMVKGDKEKGWIINTVEQVVKETTINGVRYGYVQLSDMNTDECAFTKVTIADNCNVTDAELSRVSSPVVVDLNQKQFIVLDGNLTTAADRGKVLFNSELIDEKVIISYPQTADVENFVATDEFMNERKVRMSFMLEQNDGVKIVYIYNNVLITSFPGTINNEETTFPFTISIQRDKDGRFFEMNRITQ